MLRWRVARDEFLIILSLLKPLMSWNLESIDTGWSESIKGIPMEWSFFSMKLHFVKNDLRFSSGKICITRKTKIIKARSYKRHIRVWLSKEWKNIWLTSQANIRNILFWYFLILFIVYIGAKLMIACLAGRARNLVLFCFYFSTASIAEDFCHSQCKILSVIVGLILTKKTWSCFEKNINKTN